MSVKSPYNFVPAPNNEEVFYPNWVKQINHDIPFSDGEGGEIELTITAMTPIFIRNGSAKEKSEDFSHYLADSGNPKYFIPGSSIKGMIRNVLEIITFSKLNKKLVNNDRFSFRDLTRNSLYLKTYDTNKVHCGWLREDSEGNWSIYECGIPEKITHSEIDELLGTNLKQKLSTENGNVLKEEYKTAKGKYNILQKHYIKIEKDNFQGHLVLTGQPSLRNDNRGIGKHREFLFPLESNNNLVVTREQKKDFLFIYKDEDKNNISKDWSFWKDKIKSELGVPIFFNKVRNTVSHFGLAFMYKLPYKNSVHEMNPLVNQAGENIDFAEALFGYTNNEESLKGRIFFSHGMTVGKCEALEGLKQEILSSPKASFYPFYVNGGTYQDDNANLKGFKRYPVHLDIKSGQYTSEQKQNVAIYTKFKPLPKGTIFKFKVRYHNLRPEELGALLSAITFHGNSSQYFHSLGGAKPFGYGKISVTLTEEFSNSQLPKYLHCFEELMTTKASNWLKSPTLQQLFSMAKDPSAETNFLLKYPNLENPNEFNTIKSEGQVLKPYTTLDEIPTVASQINPEIKQKMATVMILNIEELISNGSLSEAEFKIFNLVDSQEKESLILKLEGEKQLLRGTEIIEEIVKLLDSSQLAAAEIKLQSINGELKVDATQLIETFLSKQREKKLNSLKSEIPKHIKESNDSQKFMKESTSWIKKISIDTFRESFKEEFIKLLELRIKQDQSKPRLARNWSPFPDSHYWKQVSEWVGIEQAENIFNKVK